MISIQNITKQFPSVTALDDVSLEIGQKEFFGLLGPNGAGKTTLMNLLVGYLNPENGTITIGGEAVSRDNLAIRNTIGFVPQRPLRRAERPRQPGNVRRPVRPPA